MIISFLTPFSLIISSLDFLQQNHFLFEHHCDFFSCLDFFQQNDFNLDSVWLFPVWTSFSIMISLKYDYFLKQEEAQYPQYAGPGGLPATHPHLTRNIQHSSWHCHFKSRQKFLSIIWAISEQTKTDLYIKYAVSLEFTWKPEVSDIYYQINSCIFKIWLESALKIIFILVSL